ncbi:SWIM zinc finger [Pedobacter caeni]|uniref:SWIM zinc finger n=2 Tax=Pedobacter caeni TaxID=288992 RepID=A0A1M5L3R4_9SPHI|nr:SWIM zinc finger [Pedobacter caeni]
MIHYRYGQPSVLFKSVQHENLLLSNYSEVQKSSEAPCFFWGKLNNPFLVSRCLIALSNVVQSGFSLSPAELAKLKDPIVTAGNGKLRFEGFSQCAGVYARLDILPDGLDGEFIAHGTTNVDFNQPMISALGSIRQQEQLILSVGSKDLTLHKEGVKISEKKVPLPLKWIKGLTTVQIFLSEAAISHTFNKLQTLQLFQGIPKGPVKNDYYLVSRGNRPMFSPLKSPAAVCIGGLHRLRLLEPLLPYMDKLCVFSHPQMQSTTWQLYFGSLRFSLSLSRESWRGFSGEGAALESLIEDVPDSWVDAMDKYSYANQEFNPSLLAVEEGLDFRHVDQLTARLAAMGLLGFDLDDNRFFYRRLPYRLDRIMSLNPRMKDAERLITEGKVQILSNKEGKVDARVEGSGVLHTVVLEGEKARCTCAWFSKYQGDRGVCKHILAVKKMRTNS